MVCQFSRGGRIWGGRRTFCTRYRRTRRRGRGEGGRQKGITTEAQSLDLIMHSNTVHLLSVTMVSHEFGELVAEHYTPLYKFAFSLTRAEADATDLTQP